MTALITSALLLLSVQSFAADFTQCSNTELQIEIIDNDDIEEKDYPKMLMIIPVHGGVPVMAPVTMKKSAKKVVYTNKMFDLVLTIKANANNTGSGVLKLDKEKSNLTCF